MRTKEELLSYAKEIQDLPSSTKNDPIFEILAFENAEKECVSPSGKYTGFPDTGIERMVGFYYDFDDAYDAIINNVCDIWETVYNGAFLLCRFPGLFQSVTSEARMYFTYNKESGKYEQKEEPELFSHLAL